MGLDDFKDELLRLAVSLDHLASELEVLLVEASEHVPVSIGVPSLVEDVAGNTRRYIWERFDSSGHAEQASSTQSNDGSALVEDEDGATRDQTGANSTEIVTEPPPGDEWTADSGWLHEILEAAFDKAADFVELGVLMLSNVPGIIGRVFEPIDHALNDLPPGLLSDTWDQIKLWIITHRGIGEWWTEVKPYIVDWWEGGEAGGPGERGP